MSPYQSIPTKASFSDLQRGLEPSLAPVSWGLAAFRGRFAEVSGGEATAALTLTMGLVAEAQQCDEPTVWVTGRDSGFYPPDVAAVGIDLSALVVVWAQGALEAARAADLLLRSGAFGLVVLDLGVDDDLPLAAQTRLAALAKKHETALLCLTRKDRERPSLGPLISLRADARRTGRAPPLFRCETVILKDKRQGPGRTYAELCHGPDGLS